MATHTGKVVGARLPMADYLTIVARAAELKMTVSDFVLLKLFAPADPNALPLQQARQQVAQLTAQLNTLKAREGGWAQVIDEWKQHQTIAQQNALQQKAQIDKLTQQVAAAQSDQLAAKKQLQALRQALADTHNDSGLLGQMGERYWTIIDQFIPPSD